MQTFFRIAFFTVLSCLVLLMNVRAQESDTIDVIATGVGIDSRNALENALRSAVEQAVGRLVSYEIHIENDEVVTDKILGFSRGFVESYRQIGEPKTEDGLVSVRIAAKVKRNELNTGLQTAGVIRVHVDGPIAAAKSRTVADSREEGIDMLIDMALKFHASVYDMSTSWRYDTETRKVVIEITSKIDKRKYDAFVKDFTELLCNVDGKAAGTINFGLTMGDNGVTTDWGRGGGGIRDGRVLVANSWPNFRLAGQQISQSVDVYTMSNDVFGMILPAFGPKNMTLQAVDSGGNVLAVVRSRVPTPYFRAMLIAGITNRIEVNGNNTVFIFPALYLNEPRRDIWPGLSEYKQHVPLDIPQNALERISAVQISFE